MSYPVDMYSRAERILERKRERAEMAADSRRDKIIKELPEIANIQSELYKVGLEISKLFLYEGAREAKVNELHDRSSALIAKRNTILVSNGYSENALEPEFECKACNDKGYIDGRRCACHVKLLKELMREEVSRFAPLDDCTFDNFDTNYYGTTPDEDGVIPKERAYKILEFSRRYAQSFSRESKNLLFLGSTGLGKTHLSLAIANVVINRGFSVCYGTSHNICEDIRAELFRRDENVTYSNAKVLSSELLIIDDLGTEINNQYNIATIYNIINTRILAKLPTIISTNYDYDELLDKYDQRITSRLSGEFTQLLLIGEDIRQEK